MCPSCDVLIFTDSFFNNTSNIENSFDSANTSSNSIESEEEAEEEVPRKKPGTRGKLSILVINFRGMSTKVAEIEALIHQLKPDIIQATETWLNPNKKTAEVFPEGYNVYRKDRSVRNGGGILFACKKDLVVTNLSIQSDKEILWNQLELKGGKKVIFGTVYKPNHKDEETVISLEESLDKIRQKFPNSDILVAGDFNQPNIEWENRTIKPGHWANANVGNRLLDVVEDNCFEQVVDKPTRGDNILDLFLTTKQSLVEEVKVEPGVSDHHAVLVEVQLNSRRKKLPPRKVYLRNKADISGIKKYLEDFQDSYFSNKSSIQNDWDKIEGAIKNTMDKNVPQKQTSNRQNLPWFTTKHRRMIRKKKKAYNIAKSTGREEDWTYFKFIQKKLKKSLNQARRDFVSDKLGTALVDDRKSFWSFIKKLKQDEVGVADLKIDGKVISDSLGKAEALNAQFASVFTQEDLSNIPDLGDNSINDIEDLVITEEGVLKLLRDLNTNKAAGPDNIPPWILKTAAEELAPILTDFFQRTLDEGVLPSQWRDANICGIFKKGDKTKPSNYRPVSLTSVICKMMEHVLHSNIMGHLDNNDILTDRQHGFRAKRSTETQLLQTVHDFTSDIEEGNTIHVAVLDFSKAFDKVPHERLLNKLKFYGVCGKINQWIRNFLTTRTQKVVCDGVASQPQRVLSGVPQGTVLGPLLFLLYINDLPDKLQNTTRLFADDCLVYSSGTTTEHIDSLQKDLKQLEHWQNTWQMSFNPSKCSILKISTKRNPPSKPITFCGEQLDETNSHPYLGVQLDSQMNWKEHMKNTTTKGSRVLGFLQRNIWFCSKEVKATAYKTLVRPILEYASSVWDPYLKCDIKNLERIQRRAARFCLHNYKRDSSVTTMLEKLEWDTLESRRKNSRLTMLYKTMNDAVGINKNNFVEPNPHSSSRKSNSQSLKITCIKKNVHKNSFFPRTSRDWNHLPENIVSAPSVDAFKQLLQDHQ
jgi:hypothetical protein